MTLTPFLAWLCPSVPRLHWNATRIKSSISFLLIWAVQVALAILLLPALLIVLAISGVGVVIVWLASAFRQVLSAEHQADDR
ncbi:MAG: hypothetical protein ACP5XB_18000 [Isosphaeraceae bacterium]